MAVPPKGLPSFLLLWLECQVKSLLNATVRNLIWGHSLLGDLGKEEWAVNPCKLAAFATLCTINLESRGSSGVPTSASLILYLEFPGVWNLLEVNGLVLLGQAGGAFGRHWAYCRPGAAWL